MPYGHVLCVFSLFVCFLLLFFVCFFFFFFFVVVVVVFFLLFFVLFFGVGGICFRTQSRRRLTQVYTGPNTTSHNKMIRIPLAFVRK